MASHTKARSRSAKAKNGLLWYLTWPLHVVPRWVVWWGKELMAGLALGLCEGIRIGWYEIRARRIVKRCRAEGVTIYDLQIWDLLRSITFGRQLNRDGVVVCSNCKIPTHTPHCHHIKHVATHPQLAFTPRNLTGLCPPCHQEEHPGIDLGVSPQRRPVPLPPLRRIEGRRLRRKHRLATSGQN